MTIFDISVPARPSAMLGILQVGWRALLAGVLLGMSSLLHAQAPLRVMSFPGGANLPVWVAEERGLFARERLAVSLSSTPNSVVLFQSLDRSEQDIAFAAFDNVVAYQEGQGEITLSTTRDYFAFMGITRGTVRLVVAPGIREYADLRGKTLGVDAVSTGYSLVLRELLQRGGLEEADYHLVSVGATKLRAQALMEGKVSGTILSTPLEIAPEARGYRRLANAADVLGSYQTIVGISRHGWATAHRDDLVGFIRATIDATDWLLDPKNRIEAIAIYRRHLPNLAEEDAARELDALLDVREGFSHGGAFDPQGIMTVLRIRSNWGTPRKSLTDPARYVDERYRAAAQR